MKKILLIVPVLEPLTPLTSTYKTSFMKRKGFLAPLSIATIAALTPDDFEVDLWDEAIDPYIDDTTPFNKTYDLVALTGMSHQRERSKEISAVFRQRGIPVAVGGPGVTSAPEKYRDDFDILFLGEAEQTWPKFLADFLTGPYQKEYRALTFPDMSLSPAPRWGAIADRLAESYLMGAIETTRGCPFTCEFCTVWKDAGRLMRLKPIDRVLQELAELEQLGVRDVFVCSDNFIGNPRYAKELLRAIIPLNQSFETPIRFFAEISLNLARMDDMINLLAEANFTTILIGIESSNEGSLEEARKVQNLRRDIVEDCKKVMSKGTIITGSMIVGFDHDTVDVFDRHFEFLQEACIPHPQLFILRPIEGTELFDRLLIQGRILDDSSEFFAGPIHPQLKTAIIPERMTRVELITGYLSLLEKVFDWDNFAERVKGFLLNLDARLDGSDMFEVADGVLPPHWTALAAELNDNERRGIAGIWAALESEANEKGQRAIYNLLALTRDRAPFMMLEIVRLIVKQFMDFTALPVLREGVQQRVQIEASMDFKPFIAKPDHVSLALAGN
jgi:radical SAM superfamily enzyme YgiQ (UPF0313 family)